MGIIEDYPAFAEQVRQAERELREWSGRDRGRPAGAIERWAREADAERRLATLQPRYVAALLREILHGDLSRDAIRAKVRLLVPWIDRALREQQQQIRQRPGRQQNQQRTAAKRRKALSAAAAELATIQRRGRATSKTAAARVYLAKKDPSWHVGPDAERERKVQNLLRSLRILRQKTADRR